MSRYIENIRHGKHKRWEGPATVLTPGDLPGHTSAICIPIDLPIHKPNQLTLAVSTDASYSTAHRPECLSLSAATALLK